MVMMVAAVTAAAVMVAAAVAVIVAAAAAVTAVNSNSMRKTRMTMRMRILYQSHARMQASHPLNVYAREVLVCCKGSKMWI